MLAAAARAWQLEGNEVIGTAIAGATAQRLQADAKLDRALHRRRAASTGVEQGHIELGSGHRRDHGRGGNGRQRPHRAARRS